MPLQFSFDANFLVSAGLLERGDFSPDPSNSVPGLDYDSWASAYTPTQTIYSRGIDAFQMTLVDDQRYVFDVDSGTIDLQLTVIDQYGRQVATSDNSSAGTDPFLDMVAQRTGTYFVVVHHTTNDYVDGSFGFERTAHADGSYRLNVSTPSIPAVVRLSDSSNSYTDYSGTARTVKANGGNDWVSLREGNDIGLGGSGNDQIYGGTGHDELSGGSGLDTLDGQSGNDVMNGGTGGDLINGGDGNDAVNGGSGGDRLYGDAHSDNLWGELGNDTLYGGSGNDQMRGGANVDTMYGGYGADTFHFLPSEADYDSVGFNEDRIMDFDTSDTIDLTDLAWGRLNWRGTRAFDSDASTYEVRVNDLRSSYQGYQEVQVQLDGDAAPDLAFLVRTSGGFSLSGSNYEYYFDL